MDDPSTSLRLAANAGGRLLDQALAKPPEAGRSGQSYWKHVTDVYRAWCGLVNVHRGLIEFIANRNGITGQRFLQSSLLCVALHDIGKLCENFQRMMLAQDAKEYRVALRLNYRHEIAGLWLVERFAGALLNQYGPFPGNGLLEVLAVAGHHRYLAPGYLFDEERFVQTLEWKPDAWTCVKAGSALAGLMFRHQGWQLPRHLPAVEGEAVNSVTINKHLSNGRMNYPYQSLCRARDQVLVQTGGQDPGPFREIFLLLKGLLMAADWMASGATVDPEMLDVNRSVVQVPSDSLRAYMVEKVEKDRLERPGLGPFSGFTTFQKQCAQAHGHVLAMAPTGSGKTEAALLWALNQVHCGKAKKLFFLLPTMVTATSLHGRIADFFQKRHANAVGLVHSTADLVEGGRDGDRGEPDRPDVRANLLRTTHFFLPVTVATVDQLLVSLFHAGRWPLKTFAAADAAVVIDEVHAYDPHTAGLIILLLRQLGEMGTRFMVMSATMPSDLRNTILQALAPGGGANEPQGTAFIQDAELLGQARNDWETRRTPLTEWLSASGRSGESVPSDAVRRMVRNCNDRGKPLRTLIVVNTVRRCQQIAMLLRQFDPICYHSKFIFQHRRSKETEISKDQRALVIATQVVEVSLDIDYDLLLTECAPFDALVQRAGRVNRARRAAKGRVIVFPFEPGSEKVYGEPPGVLEASWKLCQENQRALTENDLVRLVEEAYAGRKLSKEQAFERVQAETRATQQRLSGVLDNPHPEEDAQLVTRLERFHEMSVIPEGFADEVSKRPTWERRLFELKMPVWYFREHRIPNQDELPLCRMDYDSELGGRFLSTSREPDPASCII